MPDISAMGRDAVKEFLLSEAKKAYESKENEAGSDVIRYLERVILLQVIDTQWKDHLLAMDHLEGRDRPQGLWTERPSSRIQERGF